MTPLLFHIPDKYFRDEGNGTEFMGTDLKRDAKEKKINCPLSVSNENSAGILLSNISVTTTSGSGRLLSIEKHK